MMLQLLFEIVGDQWCNLLRVYELSCSREQKRNDSYDSAPTRDVATTRRWLGLGMRLNQMSSVKCKDGEH